MRSSDSEAENARLQVIEEIQGWSSPRLGIRFELTEEELYLYRPDGERFASYVEVQRRLESERERAQQAEERAQQAEAALLEEQRKAELLAKKLRQMGINPDELG
ncbi:hypothetical protein [Oscillatoria sp. FACHB-1406]|uniref:hypothetical protein n=1 Tax=Oscillatoria sp. FACHB-1406 TaxID=2692846 RepID=UPI0016843BEC|nr:hypothetical protein [Oscillatoria sp. FACHB-1406]MBD2580410.1 hypothetical protein [Oscillatoria sp. FACHB-1406]